MTARPPLARPHAPGPETLPEISLPEPQGLRNAVADPRCPGSLSKLTRQILDQTHDAVIATDLAGVITGWNRGAERLYGYTAAQGIGRHVAELYPPARHG